MNPTATAGLKHRPRPIFFENLDGLRFLAFACVYIQHSFLNYSATINFNNSFKSLSLKLFLFAGEVGVSIFFVLSGFLITYLLLNEKELKSRINVFHFYLRRLLRIWPLYYAVLIFAFIVYPVLKSLIGSPEHYHSNLAYYFSFLSNFNFLHDEKMYPHQNSGMQGVTWSVSVEEQFYLIWPLLFLMPKKLYKYIFPFIILLSLCFRYINRGDDLTLYYHTLSVISDLAIGGLFAYCAYYYQKFKTLFKSLNKPAIILIYTVGIVWLVYGGEILVANKYKIFIRLINSLFFAFIILDQNYGEHSFYKFSRNKFFTFWGKYTYGLYLLHQIAIIVITIFLNKLFKWPESANFVYNLSRSILALFLVLAMSYISYEYFEKVFLKFKKHFEINKLTNHF